MNVTATQPVQASVKRECASCAMIRTLLITRGLLYTRGLEVENRAQVHHVIKLDFTRV